MRLRLALRRIACCFLLLAGPGLAGPRALAATLAVFAGDHAHHVSIEADLGHADLVLCHDAVVEAPLGASAFAPADCEDDHRLHVATAESLVSRHAEATAESGFALVPAVAAPPGRVVAIAAAPPTREAAARLARRLHRTIVLLI